MGSFASDFRFVSAFVVKERSECDEVRKPSYAQTLCPQIRLGLQKPMDLLPTTVY